MQIFYTVRPGDTIYAIAGRWSLTPQSLIATNNLVTPYTIFPGQQLSIPPGNNMIRVKAGDAVYRIANRYGVPQEAIIQANNLTPPYIIHVNQLLKVPQGVPWYVVQPGDTLFSLAAKYNVKTDGTNRYDLIKQVNNLQTDVINPGMRLVIPYAPPGGGGALAYTALSGTTGEIGDIRLLEPRTGVSRTLVSGLATRDSVPYWSPDGTKIAFVGTNGTLYMVKIPEQQIYQLDRPLEASFIAWSKDSSKLVYHKDTNIVIYDIVTNTALLLNRPGATQAQLFPDQLQLLYAQDNQLIKERYVGTGLVSIIITEEGPLHNLRLSPDGTYALYTTPGASVSLIRTVDLNSRKMYRIPGGQLGKNYYPEWASDSLRLAYSATNFRDTYYSQVRVSGRQSGRDTIVSLSDCFGTPVTWSPNGGRLAYLSGCEGGEFASELWVVEINHPAPVQVLSGLRIFAVKWSPTV